MSPPPSGPPRPPPATSSWSSAHSFCPPRPTHGPPRPSPTGPPRPSPGASPWSASPSYGPPAARSSNSRDPLSRATVRDSMDSNDNNLEVEDSYESDEYFEPEDDYYESEDYYLEPEDSYMEPEDDYVEDDDDIVSELQKIFVRGPRHSGNEPFDRHCIFGNEVEMTYKQMFQLSCYVEEFTTPPMKHYVSRLVTSQIKKWDCKMDFSTEFTCQCLMPLLKPPHSPDPLSSLVVQKAGSPDFSTDVKYCRMKLESGKGIITAGWIAAVQGFGLKEGDIYVFSFQDERGVLPRRDPFGVKTRMLILKLKDDSIATNSTNEDDVKKKITIRGPGHAGDESFDRECIFANEVHMTYNMSKQLRRMVEVTPRPKIKEYIHKIVKSNVRPECKMEFGAEFTSYYLTEILRSPEILPLVSLVVNSTESTKNMYCKIKIGQLGKATIVGGWQAAVQAFKLREGDICVFSFRDERIYGKRARDSLAWLRLIITKLDDWLDE